MKILGHASYVGTTGYNAHSQKFFRTLSKHFDLKIRNFSVSKNWNYSNINNNPHGKDINELDKSLIILQSLWGENNSLLDYPVGGYKLDFAPDLNIVLTEVNHYYFYQNYVGPKIAYTVWESTEYPEDFLNKLKEFDQVWVPTEWQKQITINQGIASEKVKVVREGVDSEIFYPEDIKYKDDKFRFLIFGRWDSRKSIKEIVKAFKELFGKNKNVELILSADNPYSIDGLNSTEERLKSYDLESDNIKVLHFPDKTEYVNYLKSGHVFLSCARSEGWNLPLIEAMACGIPCIYSNCSGQLEFAEGKGLPVKIKKEIPIKDLNERFSVAVGNWYEPDFEDLKNKMLEVYTNYNFYKQKALEDSKVIINEFSWDNAVAQAINAIAELNIGKKSKFRYLGQYEENGVLFTTDYENLELNAKIYDIFSGTLFHDENLTVSNNTNWYVRHGYKNPSNQLFVFQDLKTKEILFKSIVNPKEDFDLIHLPENKNLINLIPEKYKDSRVLGFSYFELFEHKVYEFGNIKISKDDVVFDLGANYGLFARYAIQRGAKEVHSFEADPNLQDIYESLNKNSNCKLTPKPVYSKPVKFKPGEDALGFGVEETEDDNNSIQAVNINEYIKENNIERIDYLKVDIEGSEYDLFSTIDNDTLRNKVKNIAIEYHHNSDDRIDIILNKLIECGFDYQFEYSNGKTFEIGMLYAKRNTSKNFEFDKFFAKYEANIKKSGQPRLNFYKYIIPKLAAKNKPLYILETGTMWSSLGDNMGAFTYIMADLIKNHTGGKLYTIDISEKSINSCKETTKEFADVIEYIQSDSVSYIKNLDKNILYNLDLVYLDSYDFNVPKPHDSANHHLQELLSLYNDINKDCCIAIDDNFLPNTYIMWNYYNDAGEIIETKRFETGNKILGKGMYCHDFLINRGWKRFKRFDVCGANNLFYYERDRLNFNRVSRILNNFYSKNRIEKYPMTNDFLNLKNITNKMEGLGDLLVLTPLTTKKNIFTKHTGFSDVMLYNDRRHYKELDPEQYFDIDGSNIGKRDWGGGHCIQRLQKAFLGEYDILPKPYLNKKYNPVKNKIGYHFFSNRQDNGIHKENQDLILNFLNSKGYSTYNCSSAGTVKELIDNLATCEYFIGIDSGPQHVAAGLGIKSIIILARNDSCKIYLPKLAEADVGNSEWLYPQNVHLSLIEGNELVEKFSLPNLEKALAGQLYPYWSLDYLNLYKKNITWHYESKENKLNFSFNCGYDNARIILKDLTKNIKCFDWEINEITKDVNYYIYPTRNLNLLDIDFTGFVFDLYINDNLFFSENLVVLKKEYQGIKFYSDKNTDLNIKDSFYIQYSDFLVNEELKKLAFESRTVVDIGASCGTFVDFCLQNGSRKVIALEPSDSYEILSKTFAQYGDFVITLNKALSTDNEQKQFFTTEYSTLNTFDIETQKKFDSSDLIKNPKSKIVDCITLEKLIKDYDLQRIDLLKMDIEGFEYEIFKNLNSGVFDNIANVLIEFHHNEKEKIRCITDVLEASGYKIRILDLGCKKEIGYDSLQGVIIAKKSIVQVINESGSLGDYLAWTPVVSKYAKTNKLIVDYYTPNTDLLEGSYKYIKFFDYKYKDAFKYKKSFVIGCFKEDDSQYKNLQQVACDILGLDFKEEKCNLLTEIYKKKNNFSKKYVCIATQSTSQCKYWNNEEGWANLISYLKSLDYEVVCIDKHDVFGIKDRFNYIPDNCINKTGDLPLSDRINDLLHCEFFIGLGSGLSWLAWACGKPVVMISGFSDPKSEFYTPYRVHNKNVCNSCWNDSSFKFDRNDWMWCPRQKDFECSKEITFEMVKEKVDLCIKDLNK